MLGRACGQSGVGLEKGLGVECGLEVGQFDIRSGGECRCLAQVSEHVCLQRNVRGQTMFGTTQSTIGHREYKAHFATNQQTRLKPFSASKAPFFRPRCPADLEKNHSFKRNTSQTCVSPASVMWNNGERGGREREGGRGGGEEGQIIKCPRRSHRSELPSETRRFTSHSRRP